MRSTREIFMLKVRVLVIIAALSSGLCFASPPFAFLQSFIMDSNGAD